jgi:hypothetical protein
MSTKLVALGHPTTLAQVLERIVAMDSLPSQRRHDLMSAVRRVARLLDSLPADIPADSGGPEEAPWHPDSGRSRHDQGQVEERPRPTDDCARAVRRQSHARSTPRRSDAAMARSA